jgi:hypothetical protein
MAGFCLGNHSSCTELIAMACLALERHCRKLLLLMVHAI